MENKYKLGDVVYERIYPHQKLIVQRYFNNIYYCQFKENPNRKVLALFERELMSDAINKKNQ